MPDWSPITIARFWSKVEVRADHLCWPWRGGTSSVGYGRFKVNGRLHSSHRVAYELVNGPIPSGAHLIMHRCDNPSCCNPFHLVLGTHKENVADMLNKGRGNFKRGEDISTAKLTPDDVRAIRRDQRSYRTIAADYGIGKNAVGKVKRRQTWRHVSDNPAPLSQGAGG